MCDATYHKSYGLGVTSVTEVRKCIVYMYTSQYKCFLLPSFIQYNATHRSPMQPPNAKSVSVDVLTLVLLHISFKHMRQH